MFDGQEDLRLVRDPAVLRRRRDDGGDEEALPALPLDVLEGGHASQADPEARGCESTADGPRKLEIRLGGGSGLPRCRPHGAAVHGALRLLLGGVDRRRPEGTPQGTEHEAPDPPSDPGRPQEPLERQAALAGGWYTRKSMLRVRHHGLEGETALHPNRPSQRHPGRSPLGEPPDALPQLSLSNGDVRSTKQT
jgi:hypothetical protein